ncbi:structure-specific endonuclease subunit SLX4 [Pectinophora gossypiella]|uniref:structure-specific endonuclease subunit SLX4 n=1 Tax=Pectinophora gossypiella TaxID=13191 RepID=UPI00214F2E0E|nr:structure-specific endonuclease subunit SLX4 [Pectinophora gossypiella]
MSLDSPSNSKNENRCKVISKYFAGHKSVMDESLSDFQEKKKNFTGPKNSTKPSGSKTKTKRNIKRVRGQKDIRTVLKSKKNELVAYSNDFEKICKQSGLDVDSEQLQLAIALSKSLQASENKVDNIQSSGSLSSQERTGKIRTTLLEYGFVVPDIKITATKSKKLKRYRKNYKLLQISEAEKQQIIYDRYSQILFSNFDNSKVDENPKPGNNSATLYHLVTDIPYKEISTNNIFYVEDLIEQSSNAVGCLLKDWSDIPGRPVSPTCERLNIDFNRIDCSQEELDIVLSSTLKSAQEIVKSKYNLLPQENLIDMVGTSNSTTGRNTEINNKMDDNCINIIDNDNIDISDIRSHTKELNCKEKAVDIIEINMLELKTTQNVRSCSPDIFDDEVSSLIDNSRHSLIQSQDKVSDKDATKVCNDVMDLTECMPLHSQRSLNIKPNSQLSQGSNVTKRRSNDFMEMTDCVVGSSQPLKEHIIENNIDLTQNSDDEEDVTAVKESKTAEVSSKYIESMDLTQSSDTNEELPFVEISGKTDMEDTIILNDDAYIGLKSKKEILSVSQNDFNNKSNNTEISRNPIINHIKHTSDIKSVIIESEDELDNVENYKNGQVKVRAINPIECIVPNHLNVSNIGLTKAQNEISLLDVTDEQTKSPLKSDQNLENTNTESFFEEFVYHHSDGSEKHTEDVVLCLDESTYNSIVIENKEDDIDLTQSTDSEEVTEKGGVSRIYDCNSLNRVGNVSIDYDEMFDDMVKSHASSASESKSISLKSNITDYNNDNLGITTNTNSDLVSNSSQTSEIFEISDKELDYSMHKSRLDVEVRQENFDFGGISVMYNLPDIPSLRQSNNFKRSLNRSLSDSCLPAVELKSTIPSSSNKISSPTKSCGTASSTPFRSPKRTLNMAKTPKNGEYIIKTDQVTPMLNYEAMSTPERNAELDKYGLKPFKRKRAIQLLTHLYNQTHPIVESCSKEDIPSPSKKLKPNNFNNARTNPKDDTDNIIVKSKKTINSPKKRHVVRTQENVNMEELDKENENNIYENTNVIPDIKEIHCCEEDWVFQKREKAKVHSCRVPLHIALHNYVSTRGHLREAILRYEPVNIDVIHKGLVADGYRYDPKDLLKFMDKKCITVKTADNNAKNKKHY